METFLYIKNLHSYRCHYSWPSPSPSILLLLLLLPSTKPPRKGVHFEGCMKLNNTAERSSRHLAWQPATSFWSRGGGHPKSSPCPPSELSPTTKVSSSSEHGGNTALFGHYCQKVEIQRAHGKMHCGSCVASRQGQDLSSTIASRTSFSGSRRKGEAWRGCRCVSLASSINNDIFPRRGH